MTAWLKAAGLAVLAALCLGDVPARAQPSVEQFYKGRTVTLRVPTLPGGINDIAGRLVARYLGDHIPGHPSIVVQNFPGGGGLVSANKLYNATERDGSVIGIMERGTPQAAIQGDPNAIFDPLKFTWLGSLSSYANDAYLVIINSSHPAKSVADLRNGGVSLKLGGQHSASTNMEFAMISKLVLGLNIDVVRGYPGAAPMFLAMQRGEIDGQVIGYSSVRAGQPHLWNEKLLRPLIQYARNTRHGEFTGIPTSQELAPDAAAKALIQYAESPFHMALPFLAPPGLPDDRAGALRAAFMAVTKDKAFLEGAEKANLDISPIDGDAVRSVLAQSAATPRDVIEHFKKVVSANGAGR